VAAAYILSPLSLGLSRDFISEEWKALASVISHGNPSGRHGDHENVEQPVGGRSSHMLKEIRSHLVRIQHFDSMQSKHNKALR